MKRPTKIEAQLDLKLLKITGVWDPSDLERDAAWDIYIDLVTRISVAPLDGGRIEAALASLYEIFGLTRSTLKEYGPALGEPKGSGDLSLGILAVGLLNFSLRPFLARWHAETARLTSQPDQTFETVFRSDLLELQRQLTEFCGLLAEACKIPDLMQASTYLELDLDELRGTK